MIKDALFRLMTWGTVGAILDSTLCVASELTIQGKNIVYHSLDKRLLVTGDVEVQYKTPKGTSYLTCDQIDYYDEMIHAFSKTDLKFIADNNDIIYATAATIRKDFKKGTLKQARIHQTNNSVLSGDVIEKDNDLTTIQQGGYTCCKGLSPLWQLKADRVVHDEDAKTISYEDATLNIKDVPILYIPYFTHPDPRVKRKSGLLPPSFGKNKDLGYVLDTPVFYAINDQQDLTLTPGFTTQQSGMMKGEYRHRFTNGLAEIRASFSQSKHLPQVATTDDNGPKWPQKNRWNILVNNQIDFNDHQRFVLVLNRSSDTTYLARYALVQQTAIVNNNTNLRSRFALQHYTRHCYADLQGYSFQTDTADTTPLILPKGYVYIKNPLPAALQFNNAQAGLWFYEGTWLSAYRHQPVIGVSGTRTHRMTHNVGFQSPFVLPYGHLITFEGSTRGDLYITKDYFETTRIASSPTAHRNHRHVRLYPKGSAEWKWPLIHRYYDMVVTPRIALTLSPLMINNRHIPNEDSQTFELDETNLFYSNRFQGLDRVDTGTRVIAGVDSVYRYHQDRFVSVFVGQSRRLDNQRVLNAAQGEDSKMSDFIARLSVHPLTLVNSRHRLSYNPYGRYIRYLENGVFLGNKEFFLELGHVYLDKRTALSVNNISQINAQVSAHLFDKWNVSVGQVRNLTKYNGGASIQSFLSATYDDECFTFNLGLYKSAQTDRDIRPETSILVKFVFKTLAPVTVMNAPLYPQSPLTYGLH